MQIKGGIIHLLFIIYLNVRQAGRDGLADLEGFFFVCVCVHTAAFASFRGFIFSHSQISSTFHLHTLHFEEYKEGKIKRCYSVCWPWCSVRRWSGVVGAGG